MIEISKYIKLVSFKEINECDSFSYCAIDKIKLF